MIEVSGIRVPLKALDGTDERELAMCRRALAQRLRVSERDIVRIERRRRSIDARKRGNVQIAFTLRAELAADAHPRPDKGTRVVDDRPYGFPAPLARATARPVVVGAGCAGLFCALALARAGLEPLLVERGDDAARRAEVVRRHDETGELDPESNIQFGVGGAGRSPTASSRPAPGAPRTGSSWRRSWPPAPSGRFSGTPSLTWAATCCRAW